MKLNYMTICVRNLEDSIRFYSELVGLKVVREMNTPFGRIAFVQNEDGETMLELGEFDRFDKVIVKGMILSFKVTNSLEDIRMQSLDMGYETSEIIVQRPKPDYFTVVDPDGIVIEFS